MHTVFDCIYGDFPVNNTVYKWFWPTLGASVGLRV